MTADRRERRERLAAGCCVALGAGLMLLAVSRPWVHAVVEDALAGRLAVDATGRDAAPVVAAVALVALAGAVAVLTLRAVGRTVAGLLLVLAGGAAVAAAVDVLRTPSDALRSVVSGATGRSGGTLPQPSQTPWPWLAVLGAVLVVVGGAVAVARSRHWSGLSSRYDAPAAAAAAGEAAAAAPGAGAPGPESDHEHDPRLDDDTDAASAVDPWDRLSRGEDPTA